jgi:N-acetylated-alpha-linked acidic dipeptidase
LSKRFAYCFLLLISRALVLAQVSPFPARVLGYRDFSHQAKIDQDFLAIPDTKLAQEELKTLTAVPHVAASKEDYDTALYVAGKFKAAGLETQIIPYKAWLNLPQEVFLQATNVEGKLLMRGPTRERVDNDPYQDDPRVLPAFHGSSPACDLTADAVYVNYGRPEDFKKLEEMHVSVAGKIVIVRYGANFRGVKVYLAQQREAAGVIIYSDPADDGYFQGDKYPHGPWRPETGVQRGSVQYMFKYPGDATTPDIASTPGLAASRRLPLSQISSLPTIPSMPLSYHDASPILESLGGPIAPRDWQGALPFSYHMGGAGMVKVHMRMKMEYAERTVWDVIGKIPGSEFPDDWVVAGNHRDAWVYGAVDPSSGTTAMLEAVHGVGSLLAQGWKPRRSLFFCSWDAEEEGLIGSTEWAEDHARQLAHAVAYINTDVGVSGPHFEASAVPSLKQFVREVTMEVASPKGGSVYDEWKKDQADAAGRRHTGNVFNDTQTVTQVGGDVRVGDLGSGSDYTPFIQHLGVPSTDIGSTGPYGVYHSAFDNYAWFLMNADPTFVYEQQMARIFGLEALHMADADVLPYDYPTYAKQIQAYLSLAQTRAKDAGLGDVDFKPALVAVDRFAAAATAVFSKQLSPNENSTALNASLRAVEDDLLSPEGLPGRPWFRHTIFAPGEYTGYAAVVIPGVNEAIDARDAARTQLQMASLAAALNRAAVTLEAVP